MNIPVFGLYLSVGGQIGIDRSKGRSALAQIIEQAGEVLRAGRQVYIYPEGTRRAPGAPPRYKQGVAHLYEATGPRAYRWRSTPAYSGGGAASCGDPGPQ